VTHWGLAVTVWGSEPPKSKITKIDRNIVIDGQISTYLFKRKQARSSNCALNLKKIAS